MTATRRAGDGARMKPPRVRPESIEELLAAYPARVRGLARAARRRILAVVPDAREKLRPGWGLIGYNAPAYFAYIFPLQDHVRIGFEWGVALDDPEGLLEGEGSQVRHVCIRKAGDLRSRALAKLLRAAAALRLPRSGGRIRSNARE